MAGAELSVTREHKNNMFISLFSDAQKLISLYNAISGSRVPDNVSVKIATLEEVLFNQLRNDIVFLLDE